MLEQQAAVRHRTVDAPAVHRPLQLPCPQVVDSVRPESGVRVHEFVIHVIEITAACEAARHHGKNPNVINEAELRELSPGERRRLARELAALDYPHPVLGLNLTRGRRLGVLLSLVSCVVLAGWIVVLVFTLHHSYTATHWRLAWVGFDIVELAAFAATGWAFWRGRQVVIACLLVTATLLCCDAWFDVVLDLRTGDMWMSIASAVLIELPLAFLMFNAARRLIRLSALVAMSAAGQSGQVPPLWRIPLFGGQLPAGVARDRGAS